MPLYAYHCNRCDKMHEAYNHISQRHNGPICCEKVTDICIVPPAVMPDLPGYESPVTGKWIEGRKARIEDLRRSGCRPYEEGEREEYARQQKYEEKKNDAQLRETLMRTFYAMPEAKRRVLERG